MSLEYLGVKDAVSNRVATQGELGGGSTYTSSSGITLTGSNFTNDLITGKSGGQTISLDTVSGGIGTITSTTNATKGKITIGALTIDEANARIGIGTGSPVAGYALDVGGFRSTSKTFVSLSPNAYSGNATLEIGGQGSFTGGANDFNGSSSGTTLGINEATGFAGDFINCQKIGVSYFKVSNTGGVIVGASTTAQASLNIPSGTAPTTPVSGNLYFAGGHLMFTISGTSYQLDQQSAGGGVTDGDKGDVTVSSSGTVWTVDPNAITFSKFQQISTNTLLGRSTSGTGNVESLTLGSGLSISGGTISSAGPSLGLLNASYQGYNMP